MQVRKHARGSIGLPPDPPSPPADAVVVVLVVPPEPGPVGGTVSSLSQAIAIKSGMSATA
jgi:hypothetical protein